MLEVGRWKLEVGIQIKTMKVPPIFLLGFVYLSMLTWAAGPRATEVHHYVFFNRDRERIADAPRSSA